MEIQLAKAESVVLSTSTTTHKFTLPSGEEKDVPTRTATNIGVNVTPVLHEKMRAFGFGSRLTIGKPIPKLNLYVGLAGVDNARSAVYVKIERDFLHEIIDYQISEDDLEVEVQMKHLQDSSHGKVIADDIFWAPLSCNNILSEHGQVVWVNHSGGSGSRCSWANSSYGYCQWTASVSLILKISKVLGPDPDVPDYLAPSRKMLEDELFCDAAIIADNGVEVKFHRCVLAAHSTVFATMFQSGMVESKTHTVELSNMTEESVRALREYLYAWDIEAPQEKSGVCFELLEAGHKYDIQPLENCMEKILLRMSQKWYDVDVALRLFLFVRDTDLRKLKLKSIDVLKAKFDELEELPAYQQLYKENLEAVKELCKCFAKRNM